MPGIRSLLQLDSEDDDQDDHESVGETQGAADANGEGQAGEEGAEGEGSGGDEDPVAAKVREIEEQLEAKRAEAAAKAKAAEPAQQQVPQLDRAALQGEARAQHLRDWADAAGIDLLSLHDALTELGELTAKGEAPPAVERRLSQLERQTQAHTARAEAEARGHAEQQAKDAFFDAVTPNKFPLLSALDEGERLARGADAARQLLSRGVDPDAEAIAAWAEADLRKLSSKLSRSHGEGTSSEDADTEQKATQGPKTLSASLGGKTPDPPPIEFGEDARRNRARALLRARRTR
ncbi:MAG: hypothetical protein KC501_41035 [Myxococcales bacterium]|nr:hypothetical protein [Myxococcales bacterium]